jgi:hypothetical protein
MDYGKIQIKLFYDPHYPHTPEVLSPKSARMSNCKDAPHRDCRPSFDECYLDELFKYDKR